MRHARAALALLLLGGLGPAAGRAAATEAAPQAADLGDPASIAAGERRYNQACAGYCHGRGGLPGKSPRLVGRPDLTVERIHATIRDGRKRAGKVMPGWKGKLSDEEIWQLTAYVADLAKREGGQP